MENQLDSESYWNRSTSVGFSFDDEDDSNDNRQHSTATGRHTTKWNAEDASSTIFNDDTISEASFDNSSTVGTLNFSIKSLISEQTLKTILQEQTLDDRIIPKGVSPEEELKLLRRQIQTTLYNPSATATAQKLLLGKNAALEVFKTLHEKEQLLDTVLDNGGGDAVIGVLLFLKKTLNRRIFYKILQQRPDAFEHYLCYLKQSAERDEATELLRSFGRQHDAALLQLQSALNCTNVSARKQQLLELNEIYTCGGTSVIALYQQIFHAAVKLHELIEKEGSSLDKSLNYQSTPIEVLNACCVKNNNWKEPDMLRITAPQRFCSDHNISPAQYEWTALNERARAQAYVDLEGIFERIPAWNPMKSKQFHISFGLELAVQRLHELQAPASVLYIFISKMSNSNEKLALAQRVQCTKAVIDAMVSMKQINELTELKNSLPERSEEQFYCENALKTLQSSKRWMTDNIKLKL